MVETIEAVYEDGVFIPSGRLDLPDHQKVRLTVETSTSSSPEEMLELAAKVYEGLSDEQIDEIEKIALDRRNFFGDENS